MDGVPFVSVVVPTLNENGTIAATLERLTDTSYPRDRFEVLVLDGGSSDGTQATAERIAARLRQDKGIVLRVLDNPRRLQSAAVNLAVEEADARSDWLIRCDCHAEYPGDFVSAVMRTIAALPG